MRPFDYMKWYNALPDWARVVLAPMLVPVILIHGTVGMALCLVLIPFWIGVGSWRAHRFWNKMKASGRVVGWSEVRSELPEGRGTLLVEVGPKGPEYFWWIEEPRRLVDPDRIVPSWRDYEQRGGWPDVFDSSESAFDAMDRWATERLGAYQSSAKILVPSQEELAGLEESVKQEAVLAVFSWFQGCLTKRCC